MASVWQISVVVYDTKSIITGVVLKTKLDRLKSKPGLLFFKSTTSKYSVISDIDDTIIVSYTASVLKRISTAALVAPHKRKIIKFTGDLINCLKNSNAKYFIEELKQLEPFDFTIEANGKLIDESGLMLGICNSRKYGTGVPLNISGNPMDGKFEIVIVKTINISSLIKAGLSRFDERFHDSQSGISISTDKAVINFDKKRLLQLDGEIIGKFDKLEIKILKSAVKFITNNENEYLRK